MELNVQAAQSQFPTHPSPLHVIETLCERVSTAKMAVVSAANWAESLEAIPSQTDLLFKIHTQLAELENQFKEMRLQELIFQANKSRIGE